MQRMARSNRPEDDSSTPSRLYDSVAFLLLLLPIVVGLVLYGGNEWWVTGPLAAVAFLAVLLLVLKPCFFSSMRRRAFRRPPGWLFFLAFLLYTAIRVPYSAVPYNSLQDFLLAASCIAAYWGWTRAANHPGRIRLLLSLLLLAGCALCLYALIQHARGSNLVLTTPRREQYGMRASATYNCPNHLGHVLVMQGIVAVGLLIIRGSGKWLKSLSIVSLAIGMPVLLMTSSRSAWIGLVVGLSVMFVTIAIRGGLKGFLIALLSLPILFGVAALGLWTSSAMIRERVRNAIEAENPRLFIWRDTLEMARDAYLFGHGPGTFIWLDPLYKNAFRWPNVYARYVHNEPLQLLVEYGLVGTVLLGLPLFLLAFSLFGYALKAHRDAHGILAAAALGCLSASLAHSLFDFNFHFSANNHFLILILGLAVGRMIASGRTVRPALPLSWVATSSLGALACLLLATLSVLLSANYIHILLASRMREKAAYDDALHHATRAIAWFPFSGDAYREKGAALLSKAFWDHDPEVKTQWATQSLEAFEKAQALNAYDLLTRFNRSRAYLHLSDEERSLAMMQEIYAMAPRHVFYLQHYGLALRRLGMYDESWDIFMQVRRLEGRDNPMVRANLALLRPLVSIEKLPPYQQQLRRRRERQAARAAEAAAAVENENESETNEP